ncbi:MAG: hypothetical protein GX675_05440 [Erysipelotrichaceae bacterium]|nr:hypothetical protein [Erysipelotrichaceae bacterium]
MKKSRSLNKYCSNYISKVLSSQKEHEYNTFFKSLFNNAKYEKIIEFNYYMLNEMGIIVYLARIWQPHSAKLNLNGYLSTENFDHQFTISKIEREIKLSYPTEKEINLLNIKNNEMVVIEKNKIFEKKNKLVRYEEVVFKTSTYYYEG